MAQLFRCMSPRFIVYGPAGRLAQLARAPPLQGGGRWFESNTAHQSFQQVTEIGVLLNFLLPSLVPPLMIAELIYDADGFHFLFFFRDCNASCLSFSLIST